MDFDEKKGEEYCLMSLASLLLRRLSLLAPLPLHIFGLRFLHLFLTSAALFLSSFLFQISIHPSSIQSSKHDQEQNQEQDQDQEQEQEQDYVVTSDFTGKSGDKLESNIGEDDEDGTIPDDDSLIELSLPSGHYVGHNYSTNKNNLYNIHNKLQDFRISANLFIELNDLIEEDNLIEIDISIGSIKYSRFEIKA